MHAASGVMTAVHPSVSEAVNRPPLIAAALPLRYYLLILFSVNKSNQSDRSEKMVTSPMIIIRILIIIIDNGRKNEKDDEMWIYGL